MTAEAGSATAESHGTRPREAVAHLPQDQRGRHTDGGSRAPNNTRDAPVRDDPAVIGLVTRARSGDRQAWDLLVERYSLLIWSICRRYRLDGADAEDVGQTVWLKLVEQLDRVREPAALPGWLATTTRRECLRALSPARRTHAAAAMSDLENVPDAQAWTPEDMLIAERHVTLHDAFMTLPPDARRLIVLLIEDPPVSYAEISARLGIPVGSIGPNRSRCLDKLRRHPAIAALMNADSSTADEIPAQEVTR
jgi:RNA polymerase sigma factor (sigma-70 family)